MKVQIEGHVRDLAMLSLTIDSKLLGCDDAAGSGAVVRKPSVSPNKEAYQSTPVGIGAYPAHSPSGAHDISTYAVAFRFKVSTLHRELHGSARLTDGIPVRRT